jgi:predicted DNA-binding protein (MmcQ/YjbR family)
VTVEEFRAHCLAKKGVTEEFPFGEETMVMKVGGKIFALASIVLFERISLKAEPEKAIEMRERYPAVIPGYHLNKKHWNTIQLDGSVTDKLVKNWIDDSYNLVASGLSKTVKAKILS